MKKPLILAVAAMALTAGAQAESKFYGKMNVSAQYDDASEAFELKSNASRLGVKGSDDLGSVKVIYQAEYQHNVDAGGLSARDTYLGLSYGDMGTVKMGRMDTPLKKSQGKYDLFNDIVDIKQVISGENRADDSINYTSAKMGAIQASVSAILGEGPNDGYSASVVYKEGDIYAAVAFDKDIPGKEVQTLRATAIYTMGDMRFGALVNNVDAADTADAKLAISLNASLKAGKDTFKVQVDKGDQGKAFADNGAAAKGAMIISAGADRKLAKSTKAFAFVAMADADAAGSDSTTLAFGLEHKF